MKSPNSALDPLPNARHEAFVREIASGKSATQAYINVYGTQNRHVASSAGHRLLHRKVVAARIATLQQAGAAAVALDLREIHAFLTRVVRTPAGHVDSSSDLCTRVKHSRDGATDVWMPSKLACVQFSARLQGFLNAARPARSTPPPDAHPPGTARPPANSTSPESTQTGPLVVLTEELREILIARRREAIRNSAGEQCVAEEPPPAAEKPSARENRAAEEDRPPKSSATPLSSAAPAAPQPCPASGGQCNGATPPETRPPDEATPHRMPEPPRPMRPDTAPPTRSGSQHPSAFTRVTPDDSSVLLII